MNNLRQLYFESRANLPARIRSAVALLESAKSTILFSLVIVASAATAQIVERERPAGWENLVTGGRFMDRFEPSALVGTSLVANCWGGDNVKPRDVLNGIEEPEYSYWGGNIVRERGTGNGEREALSPTTGSSTSA